MPSDRVQITLVHYKFMTKILVVDDEKPLAKALELKLSRSGFDVTAVFDGEEAIGTLAKDKFDLILLDLVMPKKDGFAVLDEIQKKKYTLKVIVTSNLGQEEDEKKARGMGAINYFVKSETPLNVIVEYINKAL